MLREALVAKKEMKPKSFRAPKLQDFEIQCEGRLLGTLRVKPSGVHWAPPDAKYWYGVSLERLAEFCEQEGKRLKK